MVINCHEQVGNLRFAASIEPDNAALKDKLAWALGRRAGGPARVHNIDCSQR